MNAHSVVCVRCELVLRPTKNGVGIEVYSEERPYQLWHADLLECPECHMQVAAGCGARPLVEAHDRRYAALLDAHVRSTRVFRAWETTLEKAKAQMARYEAEIESCRHNGRTATSQAEAVGAMQGEVDWMAEKAHALTLHICKREGE